MQKLKRDKLYKYATMDIEYSYIGEHVGKYYNTTINMYGANGIEI